MPIRLHDTRRREKVNFTTLEPGKVSMYVCGVTVYDRCHLCLLYTSDAADE